MRRSDHHTDNDRLRRIAPFRYDALLSFRAPADLTRAVELCDRLATLCPGDAPVPSSAADAGMRIAEAVLALGLGNRVNLVRCWHEPLVRVAHPPSTIHVGVLLNPQSAGSLVERGPTPSNAPAVASWKRLWGERSETRRFKDGAIVHSVVWHAAPEARHGVVAQAAAWLLARHLDVPAGETQCSIGGLDGALIAPGCGLSSTSAPRIAAAFEKLCSAIRSLRGLPLAILAIQPVSGISPR